ncbi:DUF3990 domain-containing protein [Limosilactobacillus reuteri]|uniref:DUF3990 domain-containing protein n=1 Tax=Limosilactobacillus reuteri TaxID=1598 RepID=UPI00254D1209|nr:DUF3990 domain-containing protein [Limosilactobacillus reuteri]MDK8117123.1 DUF3990 domain-containing protein [Limosilactobacillus reuteri]
MDQTITLYHGSFMEVSKPKLLPHSRKHDSHDFGNGFYLTTSYKQAKNWAYRKSRLNTPVINTFTFSFDHSLNIKKFKDNKEWLNYITMNRCRTFSIKDSYDIVIGPVADGSPIWTIIRDYNEGSITADNALEQLLKSHNLFDQYAFKTNKALKCLHYINKN